MKNLWIGGKYEKIYTSLSNNIEKKKICLIVAKKKIFFSILKKKGNDLKMSITVSIKSKQFYEIFQKIFFFFFMFNTVVYFVDNFILFYC